MAEARGYLREGTDDLRLISDRLRKDRSVHEEACRQAQDGSSTRRGSTGCRAPAPRPRIGRPCHGARATTRAPDVDRPRARPRRPTARHRREAGPRPSEDARGDRSRTRRSRASGRAASLLEAGEARPREASPPVRAAAHESVRRPPWSRRPGSAFRLSCLAATGAGPGESWMRTENMDRGKAPPGDVLAFGSFRIHPDRHLLLKGGRPVPIGSRALEILLELVIHAGELVTKEQLIARAWPDTVVDESNLRAQVASLRKTLGDGRRGARYVVAVPGRGYRFTASVSRVGGADAASSRDVVRAGNLPIRLSRTIGRDDVVRALGERMMRRRLLTITGPGGIGKTTVAVSVAATLLARHPDGACFVDLGTIANPDLVPDAVATALGLGSIADHPGEAIASFLRDRALLLVLDLRALPRGRCGARRRDARCSAWRAHSGNEPRAAARGRRERASATAPRHAGGRRGSDGRASDDVSRGRAVRRAGERQPERLRARRP